MFDECKGEKFEEVLLHLSTAVLRKAVRGRHSRKGEIAAAQRLCLTSGWSAANESNVDILVYAHEASTRRVLRDRTLRRCMLSTLNSDLLASRSSLQQERELVNRELSQQQAKLNGAKVDPQAMRKRLIQHNQEDTRWLNIAMSGDLEHGRDAMVEDKYEKLWMNAMELEEPVAYEPIPTSLLANLEQRVKLQQDRLARWRRFQNELSKRNEDLLIAQSPAKTPFKSPLKKLGSPYKSSPRRIASTRKPERAANVTMTSTWLQSLQASPIKPQSGSAKLAEAEAWDAMKSLQPPLSLQRQKTSSKTLEDDTEILCADVTDMQVSSESPASPIRETSTRTQQHRSRLPSLSKTAAKQPQNASDERISNSVTNSAAADRGIAGVPANTKDENPDDRIDEAVPMTEESSPTPQTPLETLMERTAKTMAEWQQKATTKAQPSGNASRSRTGSSATASPRKHKHTRSIPVVSTPRRSPERVTDADRAKAFAPQLDGFTNGEYAPGSPSPISAAPASLLSDSPAPADRTDQELYSTEGVPALKTAHPSAQLEFGDPTVNDESPFKPRNRLRRTPPVSPAALD